MIVENPIYKELFYMGYEGVENTYDYWTKNKKEVLRQITINRPEVANDSKYLEEFEAKVRWKSELGLKLLFEISLKLNRMKKTKVDFQTIVVKYNNELISLDEFNSIYPLPKDNESKGRMDLRGISLVRMKFDRLVFNDLDMRYSTISNVNAIGCEFNNCCLKNAHLSRLDLSASMLSGDCEIEKNKLSKLRVEVSK